MPYVIYQHSPINYRPQSSLLVSKGMEAESDKEAIEEYLKQIHPNNTDARNTLRPHLMAHSLTDEAIKLIECTRLVKNRIVAKRIMQSIYKNYPSGTETLAKVSKTLINNHLTHSK